ncbi:hypothetical protein QCA50_005848 [Cerrena zonata]|uniref:Endo-beta-1,6-galactanase-like domain-containing protein n=1 Tax=Cerrena zonata TaxID=2478898 RepID=A0AAW0GG96_9APHY
MGFLVLSAFATLAILSPALGAQVSSTPAQTFTGIGGSGAWWPYDLYNFPDSVRQNVSNLLFSDSGLGLTSYRWNVGAGGVNVSNPVRAPQTFYTGPGTYNWNADAQGVYFLRQAAQHGVPGLTMFANSAPAPLTKDKTSCNSQFVTGSGNAYGTFLADVLQHFINEGIPLNYVSPMNEPDSGFGPSPCGQEGMYVPASQRAEVINGLWNALSSRGLQGRVGILADESNSLSSARNEYATWLPQVVDKVAFLVHHTYDFPSDATYASYISFVKSNYPNLTTRMSEICCSLGNADGTGRGWSGGYDPTITNGLMWTTMLYQSFLVAGEPHYDFWTLLSSGIGCSPLSNSNCVTTANSNGWNDGVIYYDPDYASNGNHALYLTKHFWTFKHFGNFIKPGSQRRPITGTGANNFTLAVSSQNNYFIISTNPTNSASTLPLTFPETVCATAGVRTSASEDFASIAKATNSGGTFQLPLAPMSITTYTFKKGSC